jgi:hypothetical protein
MLVSQRLDPANAKGSFMTQEPTGPVLFCFDGSDGSRGALKAAADLI